MSYKILVDYKKTSDNMIWVAMEVLESDPGLPRDILEAPTHHVIIHNTQNPYSKEMLLGPFTCVKHALESMGTVIHCAKITIAQLRKGHLPDPETITL